MTNIELKLLSSKGDFKMWDDFVLKSYSGTIFHRPLWLKLSGRKFDIYGAFQEGSLIGGFIVPYFSLGPLKASLPPPLTPYSGIVFQSYEGKYVNKLSKEKEIAIKLANFIKKTYKWGTLAFSPLIIDLQPFIWQSYTVLPRYTYILNITNLDEVWNNISTEKRNDIRKAERDGLIVMTDLSVEEILNIVERTFLRQKRKWKWKKPAFKYFKELSSWKGFTVVDSSNNKLAATLIVWDEKRAYYLLGGYESEGKHRGALSLCLWESIKFVNKELRLNEFDFEGSMKPRLEKSIREFGGRITPYYQICWGAGTSTAIYIRKLFNKEETIF